MKDYGISVLDQYEINVDSTRRTRGAVLCNTDKGIFLLKEMQISGERIPFLMEIYRYMEQQGFTMTDMPVPNREEEFCTTADDGCTYILKRWFPGRECEIKRDETLEEKFKRHNRELRKVNKYVCRCSVKGGFETELLKGFPRMYREAETAQELAKQSGTDKLYSEAAEKGSFIHGDYNYHNILICPEGTAVTGFSHTHQGVQMEDLYYFLRKVLEKYQFDLGLGDRLLRTYDRIRPLDGTQMEYLAVRLAYPEKFWKIVNNYYQSNKAWIPQKNIEKLKNTIDRSEKKRLFLSQIFALKL